MSQDNISFDLPKNRSNVIKVIGVGGGGSNAVNYMYKQGFNGVDFVVCNTDAQALHSSPVPNKVQLGVKITEGLGAGASPELGGEAAEESLEALENVLNTNTKMLFLTAGMGGGTGTGAAPVIAKLAAKLGILTVGIVTMPFKFEGNIRMKQAQAGMEELQQHVDSMIVINNNKLRDVYGNLGLKTGFAKADEVLAIAAKGISEVITNHSGVNIDLNDAKTVLEKSGTAIMGSAVASGEDRARVAISKALDSPLLNDNSIKGAKNVLLLIISGEKEITLDEIGEINEYIQEQSGNASNIIMGAGEEEELGDGIKITVVATGFSRGQQSSIVGKEPEKKVYILEEKDKTVTSHTEITHEVKSVVQKIEEKEETQQAQSRVVHTLEDDAVEASELPIAKKEVEPVAKVQQFIEPEKSIMNISDDDIVIRNVNEPKVDTTEELNTEAQTTIEFDFGAINNTVVEEEEVVEKKVYDLGDEEDGFSSELATEETQIRETKTFESFVEPQAPIKETEVKSETFVDGSVRYNLADFEELESRIESAKPDAVAKVEEVVEKQEQEPEMQMRIVRQPEPVVEEVVERRAVDKPLPTETFVDPTDIPLSVKDQIGIERRERLKRFNHNFKTRSMNSSNIDDLEKQPAYKRAGVDLSSSNQRNSASRYSLDSNGGDDVVIRRNNSFLHDNVD